MDLGNRDGQATQEKQVDVYEKAFELLTLWESTENCPYFWSFAQILNRKDSKFELVYFMHLSVGFY